MIVYQRKILPDTNVGDPGALPPEIANWTDEAELADVRAAIGEDAAAAIGLSGVGFFPVTIPDPPAAIIVSPYDFLELFTSGERIAIRTAAQSSGALADWLDLLNRVDQVHLNDPNTIAGVHALVTAGLLSSDRATHILSGVKPG